MKIYRIEVSDEMNGELEEGAKKRDVPVERFITQILDRYVISPHILDNEEAKNAYAECGAINLEWANLWEITGCERETDGKR